MNTRNIKLAVYWLARSCGLFALARRLTSRGLRILCYHGGSVAGLDAWRPMLFMRPDTFAARLDRLQALGHPVLSLDEATRRLADGSLPDSATVITIDDGFRLTEEAFVPLLRQRDLPATIYVTSYYVEAEKPIFELVVQYLLWRAAGRDVDLDGELQRLLGREPETPTAALIDAFSKRDLEEKEAICTALAAVLGETPEQVWGSGEFSLMSPRQVTAASRQAGISIQLHTRRHRFPPDPTVMAAEIADNRRDLEPLVTEPLQHFCYPSGLWSEDQFAGLAEHGILSATTTDNGLNFGDTHRFALRRYLDSEANSLLEFEAELSGFAHLLRSAAGRGA